MQEKRTEAISRLARIERGRRSRQAFLDGLSSAFGSTVHAEQLLELAVTDQVRASLSLGYARAVSGEANARRAFFSRGESHAALQIPKALTSLLGEERVLLWLKRSADCGAVSLVAGQVLRACEAIRAFDGDAVSMLSADQTQGFIFDKNDDDVAETFEVSVWGSRWLEAATSVGFGPRTAERTRLKRPFQEYPAHLNTRKITK
jgi:hypothetical protein